MAEFRLFLLALWRHGTEFLMGVLFAIGGLVLQLFFWAYSINVAFRPWIIWLPGIILLFVNAFSAWRDEYRARRKIEAEQLRAQEFSIEIKHGGYYIAASNPQ